MATDPFKLLKQDHDTVKDLFSQYEKARSNDKKSALYEQIRRELERHTQVEEQHLYPALKEHKAAVDLTNEAYEEHHLAKTTLRELSALMPTDEAFDAKMTVLKENIEHHVQEEEGEMFDEARKLLTRAQQDELAQAIAAGKEAAGAR